MMNRDMVKKCKRVVQDAFAARFILVNYLRDDNGKPYGVVVGTKVGVNDIRYGVAVCNTKKDIFNKYVGVYIALQRARLGKGVAKRSDDVFRAVCSMEQRANRYWKNKVLVEA